MTAPADTYDPDIGARVVTVARSWLGTPYRHRGSLRGHGADCLGLLRGVWREIYGQEPAELPAYSDDWLEVTSQDVLLPRLRDCLCASDPNSAAAGAVLAFRFGRNGTCKHVGILSESLPAPRFIHAYCRYGVVETHLDRTWARRLAAVFDFPIRSN